MLAFGSVRARCCCWFSFARVLLHGTAAATFTFTRLLLLICLPPALAFLF
jgi:hypothetical protein